MGIPAAVWIGSLAFFLTGCASKPIASTQPIATTGAIIGVAVSHDGDGVASADVIVTTGEKTPQTLGQTTTNFDGTFAIKDLSPATGLVVTVTHRPMVMYNGSPVVSEQGMHLIETGVKKGVNVRAGAVTDLGAVPLVASVK
jgi:hypothetical protein